jgi:copper ion binding protein
MMTAKFSVPGISCHHCVHAINEEVAALEGVHSVQAALESKTVTVEHSDTLSSEAIIAAINEAGYDEVTRLN